MLESYTQQAKDFYRFPHTKILVSAPLNAERLTVRSVRDSAPIRRLRYRVSVCRLNWRDSLCSDYQRKNVRKKILSPH